MVVHVIGASGRSGLALCRSLAASGLGFVPVVRNAAKWREAGLPGGPVVADLTAPDTLGKALADASQVVSCAHARHIPAILTAAPQAARFVFLGSTRKYTKWPDGHAAGVLAGEAAFLESGRRGVMLHPTMIYGAQGEDNVQRLAALLRRLPIVPLPSGGVARVRPVHQDDVTAAIRAALEVDWTHPESIVVAGADSLSYADFVRAVARAAGLPPPRIASVPGAMLRWLAPLTRALPGVPTIHAAEIRRLLEDKTFDTEPLRRRLGVTPARLADGLARTFGAGQT